MSKRAPGYNVVYRTSVPDATATAQASRGGASPRRLASIDETQSAAIVNETPGTSSGQKEKSDAEALLPLESGSKHSKSYSKKGRGHLERQDADVKPTTTTIAPKQGVDSSEL